MVTQSGFLTVLSVAIVFLVLGVMWATWKLLKMVEIVTHRLDESLKQFERTAEDVRKTNAVFQEILTHAEKGVANVEHVTEGVRKLRKTLDAASGVLDFAVVPVLGTMAGVLAGSKAAMSLVVNRIFRKEARHGK